MTRTATGVAVLVLKGLSTEVEHGTRIYEVALTIHGHGKDISIDERGHVLEVEEEVPFTTLRQVVQRGLNAAARCGTIGKVESLTKRHEIQVGPDGKTLAHPE